MSKIESEKKLAENSRNIQKQSAPLNSISASAVLQTLAPAPPVSKRDTRTENDNKDLHLNLTKKYTYSEPPVPPPRTSTPRSVLNEKEQMSTYYCAKKRFAPPPPEPRLLQNDKSTDTNDIETELDKHIQRLSIADKTKGKTNAVESNCIICIEKPIDCCFCDCGHCITCFKCATSLKICPICRQNIIKKQKMCMPINFI